MSFSLSSALAKRANVLRRAGAASLAIALGAFGLGAPAPAQAEGQIRIAEQFGVVYLMLNVARDQHFIEQEGRKAGVDIKVDWLRLSGGAAVNDALLSGAVDVAGAGVGPLLTVWDRTHGRVLGDPIPDDSGHLKFELLITDDGQTWQPIPSAQLPPAVAGEGGFVRG